MPPAKRTTQDGTSHRKVYHPVIHIPLRELRARTGMSQGQLADLAGLTPDQISDYERGARHPTLPTLHALALALGVSYHALLPEGPHPCPLRGDALMGCGHALSQVVSSAEGTCYCGQCAQAAGHV